MPSPTNSWRNSAAVERPAVAAGRDVAEVGDRRSRGPCGCAWAAAAATPARRRPRRRPDLLDPAVVVAHQAGGPVPSATMHAPVRVARSTMASGSSSLASDRASARTSRPSASVLSTSMVLPLRARSTSPSGWRRRRHVVGERDVADDLQPGRHDRRGTTRRAPRRRRPCRTSCRHAVGRLDRQAAGVERDALADEGEEAPGLRRLVAHLAEAGRLGGSPVDAEQAAELQLRGRGLVEVFEVRPAAGRRSARLANTAA